MWKRRRCGTGRRPDFNCKTMQEPQRGSQLGLYKSIVYVPRRGTSTEHETINGWTLIGYEVRLRRTIHLMTWGPSCDPLRGSCMVLPTNSIFDALCVFDAICTTCCVIAFSDILTIIEINRFSTQKTFKKLHGTRHFANILGYIADFQISFL